MTKHLIPILLILLVYSCARVSSPMGGPEDETPPELVNSTPQNQQTRFNGQSIFLTFNEWVTTDNIESDLIITPKIETGFKTRIKKNEVQLIFNEPFRENTTYTLSFGSTITDITNKNAITGLTLSFATGAQLDSLEISGTVTKLYEQEPASEYLVSLYSQDDSLTILDGSASYYTKTDSLGNYRFQNLPSGNYRIYAVNDKNNNSKADTQDERFGFYPDTLTLEQNINNIDFTAQNLNVEKPRIVGARPFGTYFDIEFNKDATFEVISNTSQNQSYSLLGTTKARFYNTSRSYADTTELIFQITDSAKVSLIDTVKYYFNDSKIDPEKFTTTISPNNGTLKPIDSLVFTFTKPVKSVNLDSLYLQIDSLATKSITPDELIFNSLRDVIVYKTNNSELFKSGNSGIMLEVNTGAFISIENDTLPEQPKFLAPIKNSDVGTIQGTINTSHENIIVQLVNSRTKQVVSTSFDKAYQFDYLPPGQYLVRVIHDQNGNGKWDIGNILTNEIPEPVYYYYDDFYKTRVIELKKRWETTDINISF